MYDLPRHKASGDEEIRALITEHPFALVIGTSSAGDPVATQLPLLLEDRSDGPILCGHFMKGTDHHQAFAHHPKVLAVFTGPQCYVSGSWYENPHTPSTWNYMSVHVRGTMRFLERDGLQRVLTLASEYFEDGASRSPTTFGQLPRALTDRLVEMVVGFEISIDSIESVFELSQDRDERSYDRIVAELRRGGEQERSIAEAMERRRSWVFSDDSTA